MDVCHTHPIKVNFSKQSPLFFIQWGEGCFGSILEFMCLCVCMVAHMIPTTQNNLPKKSYIHLLYIATPPLPPCSVHGSKKEENFGGKIWRVRQRHLCIVGRKNARTPNYRAPSTVCVCVCICFAVASPLACKWGHLIPTICPQHPPPESFAYRIWACIYGC